MGVSKSEQRNQRSGKPTPVSSSKSGRDLNYQFIRIDLTSDEKAEFQSYLEAGEFSDVSPSSFFADGYSLKLTAQDGGKTALWSLSCHNPDDDNYQSTLTARGSNPAIALAVLWYKDHYLCRDGQWKRTAFERAGGVGDIG